LGLDADAVWRDYRSTLPSLVEPTPGVLELVTSLATRFRLGIVSNGSSASQRTKLAPAGLARGLPQGPVVISGEGDLQKPARAAFDLALARVGVEARDALFVGDAPTRDIAGAAGAGLRTCWIARGRDYPPALPPPDLAVASVLDLAEALA